MLYQGLGSPVFDKLEAELAKAALSLPATKGFEFGSGFAGRCLKLHMMFAIKSPSEITLVVLGQCNVVVVILCPRRKFSFSITAV